MNQSVTSAKRGKKRASESRLALVLPLIGWESGGSFLTERSKVKQKQMLSSFRFSTEKRSHIGIYTHSIFRVFLKISIPHKTWKVWHVAL